MFCLFSLDKKAKQQLTETDHQIKELIIYWSIDNHQKDYILYRRRFETCVVLIQVE